MRKIGLVGFGVGGSNYHAPLISTTEGLQLAGIITRSHERRQVIAERYSNTPIFDSLTDMLAAGVDAVVISTPPDSRFELIELALKAGVTVVSDKPFAMDYASARNLKTLSVKYQTPVTIFMNRRWDSDVRTVKHVLSSGKLGRLRRLYNAIEAFAPQNEGNASGGGLLRDLGSHLVDQQVMLMGLVTSVYAQVDAMAHDLDLNDGFYIILTHKSGQRSHVNGLMMQHNPGPRFRADGESASFQLDGLDIQTEQAFAGRHPSSSQIQWGVEPEEKWGTLFHSATCEKVPSLQGDWPAFYLQLRDSLNGEAELPVAVDDALHVTAILDAALISAREHRVVQISEITGLE
ncbi:Gfo/Idh/MocA family oxidoreductase [Halioxenophilus aromaticivorans]|uniref:Gfo/Idh/MocA family oxidoreductase n=1 Tax=Halioxenophilus aromaticivorans TaxID=1306992 RepID=A0AAV3U837_9ALTE